MFFSKFERMMAGRYLRAKRKEGFISVVTGFAYIGIALGVFALIAVMSVMNGFRDEMLSKLLGINGHIGVMSPAGTPFNNYKQAVVDISSFDGVELVVPMIENQLLVSSGRASEGAMVRGISSDDLMKKDVIANGIKDVDMKDFEGDRVLIGSRMAYKMGIVPGDEITLISPNGKVTAFGTVPRMKSYLVMGTFETGMYLYDSGYIFMPLEAAQKYFSMKDAVSNIDITLKNDDYLRPVKSAIEESVDPGTYVYDWKQTNAAYFNAIAVERNVTFILMTLIVLVAAFNIITGLIMLVKDKGRDIAVLRTMGATRGMIMRIFFMDGAFIGFVGTAIGLVLGVLFCDNIELIRQGLQKIVGVDLFSAEIYFLSQLPARMDPWGIALVVMMSLGLSFLATIYPAYRATKFDPVEALRYE